MPNIGIGPEGTQHKELIIIIFHLAHAACKAVAQLRT